MATTADIRNGLCIEFNNDLFVIVEFQHVKPGKGGAFVRTKLKSLTTGKVISNTFNSGTKIDVTRVERRPYQFLYKDDNGKFNTIPWDMNMSFGSFRETDGSYHFNGLKISEMKIHDIGIVNHQAERFLR